MAPTYPAPPAPAVAPLLVKRRPPRGWWRPASGLASSLGPLWRRLLGLGLAMLAWHVLAEPALADHCQDPSDCFSVQRSALAAAVGVGALAALSLALDFTPIVGTVKGILQAITGRDLITGERLSNFERAIGWIPFGGGRVARGLGDLAGLGRVADDVGGLGRV
ncbi:MAG: pre-toxin TG domain-containing protein, partial [Chloroflexota bacterium]